TTEFYHLSLHDALPISQNSKYKCMLQMSNYMGEGAYVVVSLINSKGDYEKTLYVMGDDKKWYNTLKEWHKFHSKKPSNISAKTRSEEHTSELQSRENLV